MSPSHTWKFSCLFFHGHIGSDPPLPPVSFIPKGLCGYTGPTHLGYPGSSPCFKNPYFISVFLLPRNNVFVGSRDEGVDVFGAITLPLLCCSQRQDMEATV